MTHREPDLRILGASDGYAHALIHLRTNFISPLVGRYSPGINPRHINKLAAREAKLKPLRELEAWLVERHKECRDAYTQVAPLAESPAPKAGERR